MMVMVSAAAGMVAAGAAWAHSSRIAAYWACVGALSLVAAAAAFLARAPLAAFEIPVKVAVCLERKCRSARVEPGSPVEGEMVVVIVVPVAVGLVDVALPTELVAVAVREITLC